MMVIEGNDGDDLSVGTLPCLSHSDTTKAPRIHFSLFVAKKHTTQT